MLDPLYLIFALPGIIIGLIAQLLLKGAYNTYSKVSAGTNITGNQAAEILNRNESFNVELIQTKGELNDYFDPSRNIVNISSDNALNSSVANIAVVAHEFGHVQQKFSGNALFRFRSFLVPVVQFGGNFGIILIMIGLGAGTAALGLVNLGIFLFATTTLFALITLPIEIDASRRGLKLIEKHNLIVSEKRNGAKIVLIAAALTYFAGLVEAIGQLLYFVMLSQSRNKD